MKERENRESWIRANDRPSRDVYHRVSSGSAESGSRLNQTIQGVSTLFTKTNLLPWRYSMCIKDFGTPEKARTFLEALRALLFDQEVAAAPIDAFNDHMRPLYDAYLREGAIKPASHSIPSLALWLSDPQHHFFIRPEVVNRAARILTGGVLEGPGSGHDFSVLQPCPGPNTNGSLRYRGATAQGHDRRSGVSLGRVQSSQHLVWW